MVVSASERLVKRLELSATDAVVLHNPSNIFYITGGYTGEGIVLVSASQRVIVTDFRYTEQAERQAPDFTVVMTDRDHPENARLGEWLRQNGITRLLYEDDVLTVRQQDRMLRAIGAVRLESLNNAPEAMREIKTGAEIEAIGKACAITSEAFNRILGSIREGVTEKELALELDFLQRKLGAEGNSFDTIMAFGENGSLPHAIPGDRKLRRGDMITMDFGCKFGHYCSDMTRTVAFGQPSETMLHVYNTVFTAQQMGVDALAPGKSCFEIDRLTRDYIDSQGYAGRFGHGLGHAVGIDIHENPRLSMTCHDTVQVGHVLTVEPGVYLPGIGGVRIEDTCAVVEGGCKPLTSAPKELIIL